MMKVLKWLVGICATLFGLLLVAFITATMTIRTLTRVASLALMTLLVVAVALGQEKEEVGANDPVRLGPESAATTIEVFIDYQCPSCAAMYPRLKELHSKHPKRIAIIYRHIPLSIHDKAMIAAQAVEAARIQGKGVQMADMILTNQHLWANDPKTKTFGAYARKIGLDVVRYRQDFESEETKQRIESDKSRARSLNINSTPTVLLNGRLLTFAEASEIETLVLEGN